MKMAAATAEARTAVVVALALVAIALAVIAIALFVARHLIAYTIARVVAVAIAFVGG